jgi:osmoprotectant transport system substrate-binding protein
LALALLLAALGGCAPRHAGLAISVYGGQSSEQQLLTAITVQALSRAGYRVVDRSAWGDDWMVRKALAAGNADLCWAYTGDTWSIHLQHDLPIWDAAELYQRVRAEDALRGITWLTPTPCENALGLVVRTEFVQRAKLRSIDDLIIYLRTVDPTLRLAVPEALVEGAMGLPGLERVYGYTFDRRRLLQMDGEAGCEGLLAGDYDIAVAHRSQAAFYPQLSVLPDSRRFFPPSQLAVGVRSSVLAAHPQLESLLAALSRRFTSEQLAGMNWEMAVDGRKPAAVARRFLRAGEASE